jgi:hypothetical protein
MGDPEPEFERVIGVENSLAAEPSDFLALGFFATMLAYVLIRPSQRYLNPRRFGWARRVSSGQRRASGPVPTVAAQFAS